MRYPVVSLLQVETIGDAYMVVSGAPIVTKFHAVYIAEMSFDMMETMKRLPDPSRTGDHLKIRLGSLVLRQHVDFRIKSREKCFLKVMSCLNEIAGLHTGKVVAGVVGMKMPPYCLFGESVYIANAMEATGEVSIELTFF